jgi:acetyltransferase-like isoleucine patch superfamily enzyme
MSEDLRKHFAACGDDVTIEPGVHIEHPELWRVGDHVRIASGFYCQGTPRVTLDSSVTFLPNCFMQGAGQVDVANDVTFFPQTYFSTGGENGITSVGHKSHFAPGCALYGAGGLRIGEYCNIAAHVVFASVQHDPARGDKPMALMPGQSGPITLERDVWIGANATIMMNTFIAEGCIIGANAALTHDTEPYGLYLGVPARRLRDRRPSDSPS